jgi:ribonucleoside-diphosphate reductase alpha chain
MRNSHALMEGQVAQVKTPDGTMFVAIHEKAGIPCGTSIWIGKAGSNLAAWADACARLITLAIEHGVELNEVYEELSSTTSDKLAFTANRVPIRSGPEGVAVALLRYEQHKSKEIQDKLNIKPPMG